jgi:dolichol-phosphate mannosyltransferase
MEGDSQQPAQHVSVVLPMYREAAAAPRTVEAVKTALDPLPFSYEILCVDDGSDDGTLDVISGLAAADARVRVCSLSRHFGKEAAIMAGLARSSGDAVAVMDADLQHPPELLPQMLESWQRGYEVIHAVKRTRAPEPALNRLLAGGFNWLLGTAAGTDFQGASDFKVLDRLVVEALLRFPERNRFFRGLVAWAGFRSTAVPFEVPERVAGESKWSRWRLLRYSIQNLAAFSSLPLRLTAGLGVIAFVLGVLLIPWTLYRYLRGDAVTGFTTVILLQLMIGGLLLTGIGVVALYVAEIFQEIKQRPVYLERRFQETREMGKRRSPRS